MAHMSPSSTDVETLYVELLKRLIETGEWDRIRARLTIKLNEAGILDQMKCRGGEKASVCDIPLSFRNVYDDLRSFAEATIPLSIEREIVASIQKFLESQVEA
ncbi:hypothetical protein FISHEDRAFT_77344 [Fistulina hepatica ATCC 64428]|uniref:Transcription and mRNA export factor SUS1 n=1 Tax=Fistulina hepatica ATCC 64428 TaxID=1128425 RepID=A0A0D7A1M8_9AGAR|nr:hypothetical protein FISHEDRAFT_77344 [Fistulina hepatica ATCC 64428]